MRNNHQPKFEDRTTLFIELKTEVDRALINISHYRKRNHQFIGLSFVLLYIIFYLSSLLWQQYFLFAYIAMGLLIAPIFLTVIHDAVHNCFFKSRKWNSLAVYLLDFLGANSFIWKKRHTVLHHNYSNVAGWDSDIEQASLFKIFPQEPYLRKYRFQHFSFLFFYPLYLVNWMLIRDFKDFFIGTKVIRKVCDISNTEILKLFLYKLLYWFYIVGIPIICGVSWRVAISSMLIMLIVGAIVALLALLTPHVNHTNAFPTLKQGNVLSGNWFEHQFKTTNDVSTTNWFTRNIMGNFNFHIAHHLFPHVSACYTPEITDVIVAFAKRHKLLYRSYPIQRALQYHYELLKQNAKPGLILNEDM